MEQGHPRKKILFLITKSNFGGAQRYVLDLALALPRRDFDVAVALGGTGAPGARQGLLAEKLQSFGVRTIFIPSLQRDISLLKEFTVLHDLIALFHREKPDIVHLNSSKIGGTGSLAARIAGIPKIIFTVHGWAFTEDRGLIAKQIIRFFSWVTVLLCTDLITISKTIEEQTLAFPAARGKTHLIYNGIAELYSKPDKHKLRAHLGLGEHVPVVGMIAELTKNKGVSYAIEAFAAVDHPDAQLVIIGDGEEREILENLARKLEVKERVHFLGFRDNAAELLGAFDILLMTSVKEGLPFTLLEAGRAGVAVIATNVGGIPELITHEGNGLLVEPKDVFGTTQALIRLIQNPGAREIVGKSLQTKVHMLFSVDSMIESTRQIYNPDLPPPHKNAAVIIIRNQLGNFLFQLRDDHTRTMPGEWCLLGGHMEGNETPHEGIIREVKEETNLTLTKTRILSEQPFAHGTLFVMYGEVDTGKDDMRLGEGREIRFLKPREATEFISKLSYSNFSLELLLDFLKTQRLA